MTPSLSCKHKRISEADDLWRPAQNLSLPTIVVFKSDVEDTVALMTAGPSEILSVVAVAVFGCKTSRKTFPERFNAEELTLHVHQQNGKLSAQVKKYSVQNSSSFSEVRELQSNPLHCIMIFVIERKCKI
ncbi:hypothetical protein KIN20_000212 [Parelaphostrongylus tenuis]|uniref:Uncharacterized protein n=1 Tax=Parelaphostrongylus tenuis TaxID=148309 RepID=A0AAD5LUF4_PARTN|nr:hypothetical protein KIN20_000212 [Parelaphostrongylus tenuis]